MAVRQRPQAPNPLYKLRPIVPSIAPCWHAITQAVLTFDFCLIFFLFFPLLAYFEPQLLTRVPLQQQGALPALCLILWHLVWAYRATAYLALGATVSMRDASGAPACRNIWRLFVHSFYSPLSLYLLIFFNLYTECTSLACSTDHLQSTSMCIMSFREI